MSIGAAPEQQAQPTMAELSGQGSKYGHSYVSNWDLLHKRHLMNETPVAQQDMDVLTTNAPEMLSQQIQPEGAPGFVQNPGTYIPSQNRNRHLISNADPAAMPLMPGSTSSFSGNVLPVTNPPETVFRPGLRYAPGIEERLNGARSRTRPAGHRRHSIGPRAARRSGCRADRQGRCWR